VNHTNNTYEELMIKTLSLLDNLPDRIKDVEKEVSDVKNSFNFHDGEQRQGIKRTDERIVNLDKMLTDIKKTIDTIKHLENMETCPRSSVTDACNKINDIENDFAVIEEEYTNLKAKVDEMSGKVDTLYAEWEHKEENKKTIKSYLSEAFKSFLRYAMLPLCIIFLVAIGVDASYIPWYKPTTIVSPTPNNQLNHKIKALYNKNDSKYILEGEILHIYYSNSLKITLVSDGIFNRYEYPAEKIILWLPKNKENGYLYFGDNKILIKRR